MASWNGEALRVPFVIPGERVRVRVGGSKGRRLVSVVEVLDPSAHRVFPRCRHFGERAAAHHPPCGGCSWQHIAYAEQLRLKSTLIDDIVRDVAGSAPAVKPTIPGVVPDDPWGYRHKVHFVFANTGRAQRRPGVLRMGHYARGSREVVPIRECPVHADRGNAVAFALHEAFSRAGILAADPAQAISRVAGGVVRSIAIRVARHTSEVLATLVVTDDGDKRLRSATRRALDDLRELTGFHVNVHSRDDPFIFGRDTRRISGAERLREEVAGLSFLISPTAFFQTNLTAAAALVHCVLAAVPKGASVLDLYAGVGLFALPLARAGHRVLAIEESRTAVADGEASMRLNRLDSQTCRFLATRVESGLQRAGTPDVVILDPPRDGCSPEVVDGAFGRLRPRRAIYVSCNPETLGRDLARMIGHGYRIESVQPVDMFPHTAHVETVVVLDRVEESVPAARPALPSKLRQRSIGRRERD